MTILKQQSDVHKEVYTIVFKADNFDKASSKSCFFFLFFFFSLYDTYYPNTKISSPDYLLF